MKVTVSPKKSQEISIPKNLYGIPSGEIWEVRNRARADLEKYPSYFIGLGHHEWPILFFYSDDEYCIGNTDKKMMSEYVSTVYAVKVNGKLTVSLEIE